MSHNSHPPTVQLVSYARTPEPTHTCPICQQGFAPGCVGVALVWDGKTIAELICDNCVEAGPQAAADAIRDYNAATRSQADRMCAEANRADEWAAEIARTDEWPSYPALVVAALAPAPGTPEGVTP